MRCEVARGGVRWGGVRAGGVDAPPRHETLCPLAHPPKTHPPNPSPRTLAAFIRLSAIEPDASHTKMMSEPALRAIRLIRTSEFSMNT